MMSELSEPQQGSQISKRTGWAIIVALFSSFVFYIVYLIFFTFIIAAYSKYDRTLANGIGAILLVGFGPNVLGVLSGTAIARKLFPHANSDGLFYGICSLLVTLTAITVIKELSSFDSSWVVAAINIVISIVTVFVLRAFLLMPTKKM